MGRNLLAWCSGPEPDRSGLSPSSKVHLQGGSSVTQGVRGRFFRWLPIHAVTQAGWLVPCKYSRNSSSSTLFCLLTA